MREAVAQVEQRLPPTGGLFKTLSSLHPSKVLSQVDRTPFLKLPFPHLMGSGVEEQYRKILHVDWREEPVFEGEIPQDTVKFWVGVHEKRAADGFPFTELAQYALWCLATPVSNAVVERVFSHVTAVKTKIRNRMALRTLDAVVRIRTHFRARGECCNGFRPTRRMLELFRSDNMYGSCADDVDNSVLLEDFCS